MLFELKQFKQLVLIILILLMSFGSPLQFVSAENTVVVLETQDIQSEDKGDSEDLNEVGELDQDEDHGEEAVEDVVENVVENEGEIDDHEKIEGEEVEDNSSEEKTDSELPELAEPDSEPKPESEQNQEISTGTASGQIDLENILNTNIIDLSASDLNASESAEEKINTESAVSQPNYSSQCSELGQQLSELDINISNFASSDQLINLLVNTGGNTLDSGQINTGSASGVINLTQHINTTLIGECWSYFDHSIFEPTDQDLVLPFEGDIFANASKKPDGNLISDFQSSSQSNSQSKVEINNTYHNDQIISMVANTGGNSLQTGEIKTGQASSLVQTIDSVNQTILADNWFYIEIANPHYWTGKTVGLDIDWIVGDGIWYYWHWFLPEGNYESGGYDQAPKISNIKVDNNADISTAINMSVNTGDNQVNGSGLISTGDASAIINVRNKVNTTIIGNNWYYVSLNLFAPFSGNIVFPWSSQQVSGDDNSEEDEDEQTEVVVEENRQEDGQTNSVGSIIQDYQVVYNEPQIYEIFVSYFYEMNYVRPEQNYLPRLVPASEGQVLGVLDFDLDTDHICYKSIASYLSELDLVRLSDISITSRNDFLDSFVNWLSRLVGFLA